MRISVSNWVLESELVHKDVVSESELENKGLSESCLPYWGCG